MFAQVTGKIKYNGKSFDEFFVQRTSAYISQTDNHIGELTVRETLDFAARCQGADDNISGWCPTRPLAPWLFELFDFVLNVRTVMMLWWFLVRVCHSKS